jgi:oligoendopeptidase F
MFIRMYTQAYHNWIMKDLSLSESSYPMNLAETASIFFEVIH